MSSETGGSQVIGVVELFSRNGDFRALFASRVVSLFGDWFNLFAILAMLREFGYTSASSFGLVLMLKALPAVIAPAFGVVVDRFSRRWVMVVADALRAVIVLGMFGLAWYPNLYVLYALVVLQTLLGSIFEPARNALLPNIVRPEALTAANAASAATWSVMLAIGAAAGGFFTDWMGWEAALLLDACTYVVSVGCLWMMKEPPRLAEETPRLGLAALVDGIRFVVDRPRVWTLVLVKPIWQLTGARSLVFTMLAESVFFNAQWPLFSVSILFVARGVGTGAGPFLSRWLTRSDPRLMERALVPAFFVSGLFYVFAAVAPSLWVAAPAIFVAHLGGATVWVFSTIRIQQLTPSKVRGRVFSLEQSGFTLVMSASIYLFGLGLDAGPTLIDPSQWVWLEASGDITSIAARVGMLVLGVLSFVPMCLWGIRGFALGFGAAEDDTSSVVS